MNLITDPQNALGMLIGWFALVSILTGLGGVVEGIIEWCVQPDKLKEKR